MPKVALARWRLRLAEFTFTVEYLPGTAHHAANVMSRLPSQPVPLSPSMTNFRHVASRRILCTPLRKFPSSTARPCLNTSAWNRLPPTSENEYSRTPHGTSVEPFDFEACFRVIAFQFTRGSALYRESFQFLDKITAAKCLLQRTRN
jgi:hypothetical protein